MLCVDAGVHHVNGTMPVLRRGDNDRYRCCTNSSVEYVDCHEAPVTWYPVPGGGLMFDQVPGGRAPASKADAVVSVQKMKNHAFMGITLCLKNLFGLMPMLPLGRPRHYYHHLVRMPYMLADLGRML